MKSLSNRVKKLEAKIKPFEKRKILTINFVDSNRQVVESKTFEVGGNSENSENPT